MLFSSTRINQKEQSSKVNHGSNGLKQIRERVGKDKPERRKLNFKKASQAIKKALAIIQRHEINDSTGWLQRYAFGRRDLTLEDLVYYKDYIRQNDVVFEYGSAPFVFPHALKQFGIKVITSDISTKRFKNFKKLGLKTIEMNYDLDSIPLKDNSIDVIICNEVFEHLRGDLIFTFTEAHRVLKPGGRLIIGTPNLLSLNGIFNIAVKQKAYSCAGSMYHEWSKLKKFGHMGHVREYTEKEVVDFLSNIGFKHLKTDFTNSSLWKFRPSIQHRMILIIEKLIPRLSGTMKIHLEK